MDGALVGGASLHADFQLTRHAVAPQDIRKERERATRSVMIYDDGQGRGSR
jgi:hypothetical protein